MSNDISRGSDMARLAVGVEAPQELIISGQNWKPVWRLDKWHRSEDFDLGFAPDETLEIENNLLVSGGTNLALLFLIGDVNLNAYGSGDANLRVASGSTAATSGDQDLVGEGPVSKGMDATYPQVIGNSVIWRSTFESGEANFTWNEVGVVNGAGTPDGDVTRLLNRKVQNFGTKASGSTWQLTLTILVT